MRNKPAKRGTPAAPRRSLRPMVVHLLFGAALVVLLVLGSWWVIHFVRSVDLERTIALNDLVHASVVTALMLGHQEQPPALGLLPGARPGQVQLEVIPIDQRVQGDLFAPLVPHFPELGVRPVREAVSAIEAKVRRRHVMVIGESSLLMLLLLVCTVMLYRLVRQERTQVRRMEEFVAQVTHEMKTPLAGVKSMLQTFADGRVPAAAQGTLYAMGLKEVERLEHMVENMLISGRLRGGAFQIHAEQFDLRALLERFVEHRRRTLIDRPDTVRLEWPADKAAITVHADPSALVVILENLTDNAIKYGGPNPEVTLHASREAGQVQIQVRDRGTGFAPALAEELFLPFKRSLDGKDTVRHGTGLGLSIARSLARRMGGELTAASAGPGQGSCFTLTLKEAQP